MARPGRSRLFPTTFGSLEAWPDCHLEFTSFFPGSFSVTKSFRAEGR